MSNTSGLSSASPLPDLTAAALAGDADAWRSLVTRLERVVWKAVNMMTTDAEARNDAFAATWLRLAERLHTIREPEKLPGWLTTTATNEVRQILRHRSRQHVSIDATPTIESAVAPTVVSPGTTGEHASGMILAETRRSVREAFALLDEDCRELLTLLVLADPPMSYQEVSEHLGRPMGSLGPSRRRCLERLKGHVAARLPGG